MLIELTSISKNCESPIGGKLPLKLMWFIIILNQLLYTVRNFCIKLPLHVMEVLFNNEY